MKKQYVGEVILQDKNTPSVKKEKKYILKEKKISDIRIFDSSSKEKIYNFPEDYLIIATSFVDKLREYQFLIKGNNYFMIHFVPQLQHMKIMFERENKWDKDGKGKQEINVGVDPLIFNKFTEKEKSIFIIKLIAKILTQYIKKYNGDTEAIRELESLILKYGGDLEVVYKTKETKKYKLIISYQTKGHDESDAILEYVDKFEKNKNKKLEIPLRDFLDIEDLISAINIKDGDITIEPKE